MPPRTSNFRLPWLAAALGLALSAGSLWAAGANPGEAGRPIVRTFPPGDYGGHNQVFTMAEAPNGLFYFAVYALVLEFDGRTWNKIPVHTSWIRTLTPSPDGTIHVGGTDELGVVRPGPDGLPAYESWLSRVPERLKPFGPVWFATWYQDAIWFATGRFVIRFRGNEQQVWEYPTATRVTMVQVDGQLFLRRVGEGLYRWDGAGFAAIPAPPEITTPSFVSIVGGDPRGLIFGTEQGKFFHFRDDTFRPWESPLAGEIARSGLRSLLRLRDGSLAATTAASGIVLAEADGRLRGRLTETAHGIASDVGYVLHEDGGSGLWLTSYGGVSRIELGSGLTIFDQRNGRGPTIVHEMLRWRGRLHLGTNDALYALEPTTPEHPARLTRLGRPSVWANNLELHGDALLNSDERGVMRYREQGEPELVMATTTSAAQLLRSVTDPDRFFVGTVQGVQTFRFDGERFVPEGPIANHGVETQSFLEEADGTLWLGTTQFGYVRARRRPGKTTWQDAELFALTPGTHGVPADPGWCRVMPGPDGTPMFSTGGGAFVYDAARETLVPAPAFAAAGKAGLYSYPLVAAGPDTIYTQVGSGEALDQLSLGRLVRRSAGWQWQDLPKSVSTLAGYLGAYNMSHDPDPAGGEGVLWVSGRDALVRVDLATALGITQAAPAASVRQVSQRNAGRWGAPAGRRPQPLRLAFSREPIVFAFAAPRYDAGAALAYQTRLRGYDDNWSEWSPRGEASYTNLSGGPFTFEVRARDADGRVGAVSGFTFQVAPPWHSGPLAFVVYGLALAGSVLGFVRWRLRHAESERLRLEQLVAQRTTELKFAKDAADEASRAKSLFLANMSHELRTPLNGVIGYAQILQKSAHLTPPDRERLHVVQTSGEHLLRMINDVLDLSKIEAGKLELRPAPFHLPQLLRDIAANLAPRAEQKGLAFRLTLAPGLVDFVVGDAQKLRQVLDNLLSNAVKFTAQGAVELRVSCQDDRFTFVVTDTGIGISTEDQARLFQPFQQAGDVRRNEPGTGLGLSISQRIVALMGGSLAVASTPGQGSTFSFAVQLETLAVQAPAPQEAPQRITGYAGARRRLLVVDDITVNRTVLLDLLAPLGFEMRAADNGAEALAIASAFQPDAVFLDLRMPGMDGLEVARRLRNNPNGHRPKLIAMSASVLSFNRDDAFAAGCDDFLPKPFRESELIAKLATHLHIKFTAEATADAAPSGPVVVPDAARLDRLMDSARRGEIAALRRQVTELRASHPGFAAQVDAYLAEYHLDALRAFLEKQVAERR
jgi:signal transduction histidine kinase/DNA-binding response OmpR family regulator